MISLFLYIFRVKIKDKRIWRGHLRNLKCLEKDISSWKTFELTILVTMEQS